MTTSTTTRSTRGAAPPSLRRVVLLLVGVLVLVLPATMALASNHRASSDSANENSEAEITVVFEDDCSGFHVESSKEISFVSTNNAGPDATYHKFEDDDIESEDQDHDGDDPDGSDRHDFSYSQDDPYKSIVVKSGTTTQVFDCLDGGGPGEPGGDPECSDGEDNDGDDKVDHPDDPGCETPDDDDERDGGEPDCTDEDGDGFGEGADCDGPDCDDTDPAVHEGCEPDCTDEDGDGFGEGADCDGPDCDDTDPAVHEGCEPDCTDEDGDGFGEGADCDGPDCDDTDPAVHEGCEPDCTDEDGDGFGEGADCDGPDCDDTDPAIHDGCTTGGPAAEAQLLNLGALSAVSDVVSNGTDTDPGSEEDEGILSALADGQDLLFPPQECPLPVGNQCGLLWETDNDSDTASTGVLLVEGDDYYLYVITSDCDGATLLEGSFMGQGGNLWDALNDGSGGALADGLYNVSIAIQENGNVLVLDLGGEANNPDVDGPLGEFVVGHARCDSAS